MSTDSVMNFGAFTFEHLVAFAHGELDGAEAARLEGLCAASPDAAAALEEIRELLTALQTDDAKAPTLAVLERAIALFVQNRKSKRIGLLERAGQIIADLVFDSRRAPALAGFRGEARPPGFQLAYQTKSATVDMQVLPPSAAPPHGPASPAGPAWRLRGQLSCGGPFRAASVSLVDAQTGVVIGTAAADDHGRFKLEAPPGDYQLLIDLHEPPDAFTIPDFQIA